MTYRRVIPRDLFNEASLLKCMAQLSLFIHDACPGALTLEHDGAAFHVEQDPATGAIEVTNLRLLISGKPVRLTRPLNSREPWPLYAEPALDAEWFDPVSVFDADGDLTDEFEALIGMRPKCEHCDDTGLEPARMTHDAGDGEGEDQPCSRCQS